MWGTFTTGGSFLAWPGTMPKPSWGSSSLRLNRICIPTQTPNSGRPLAAKSRTAPSSRRSIRFRMQAPKCPTPGTTSASASSTAPGSSTTSDAPPTRSMALATERRFPIP